MIDNAIKLFGMSHQMVESDLDRVERELDVDLHRDDNLQSEADKTYYPQFSEAVRKEAATMARHYEIFYCLERTIRQLISEKFTSEIGANWWATAVPENIRRSVEQNIKREQDSGVTARSTENLDYTTFGELGEIVRHN
jgi:hypothetical protein